MKEELQEGHFDNQGHYHWKKDADADLKDHWLDNIDWVKVNYIFYNNYTLELYTNLHKDF